MDYLLEKTFTRNASWRPSNIHGPGKSLDILPVILYFSLQTYFETFAKRVYSPGL